MAFGFPRVISGLGKLLLNPGERSTFASPLAGEVWVTCQIESINCSAVIRLGTGPLKT